jgi:hypothetical protein
VVVVPFGGGPVQGVVDSTPQAGVNVGGEQKQPEVPPAHVVCISTQPNVASV